MTHLKAVVFITLILALILKSEIVSLALLVIGAAYGLVRLFKAAFKGGAFN